MANQFDENDTFGWVTFTTDVDGPKLVWLEEQLKRNSIPTRRDNEMTMSSKPTVQVPFENYTDAGMVLNGVIGTLEIGGIKVRWNDLPDDHPIFTMVSVQGPAADNVKEVTLPFEDITLPQTLGTIRMYETASSNASAIGRIQLDDTKVTLYVRFKGGTIYRYFPVPVQIWADLIQEAQKAEVGIQEASVGSLVHYAVKVPADDGVFNCHKLADDNQWYEVLPKSKRGTTADKYKKGKK